MHHSRRTPLAGAIRTLLPLCILLLASTASAASAVLGIDLGTNFIKAAIVKPGTPLDIVLTKDSKRKEASAVTFKPLQDGPAQLGSFPERLYGGDALSLAGRFPGDVYTNLKPLLGLNQDDTTVLAEYTSTFPAINVQHDKGAVAFRSVAAFGNKEQPWSVEELLAMELKNIRANAEVMTGKGSRVTDAVITVPAFYTADERRAVQRAADLAGLNVMGLITDGLAIGVDYSVKREFPNVSRGGMPELHLVFDMGASSTTATVLRFQSRDVKAVGKFNDTIQEVAVLGTGWDRTLGGNALNGLVLDHLVAEFVEKPQAKSAGISASEVKKHGRTASKLWRESERARQVLSANLEVRSSFEGLYQDVDFSSKLSRAQFEELAASFAERIEAPINLALEAAKISLSDLDSVIVHGGAVRTPFVMKKLEALAGKSTEIRSNVNPDESAAFGAAFKAAGLSSSFRVKEIRSYEAANYAAGIVHSQSGKEKQQQLFVPVSLSGTPKQIQLKEQSDFTFDIYQKVDGQDRLVYKVETKNLTAGVKALHSKYGCAEEEIATKFSLRLSPFDGLPELASGTVSCSVDASKKGGLVDSVKGLFGGKKADQEPLSEDADAVLEADASATPSASASSSASDASPSGKANKTESVKTTRTESINVAFNLAPVDRLAPSKEDYTRMTERLAAFDRSDNARIVREEASNKLESFIYSAGNLVTNSGFVEASTEAVRSEISALLSSTSEWLHGEGTTAPSEVLKEKLADLKKLIDPVQKRREEAKNRPDQIKSLEEALERSKTFIENVAEAVSKAAAEASSTLADAASTVSSAVVPDSSAKEELDDLEEPDTSTSSSAKASPSPATSSYTQEDLTGLQEVYDSVSTWLQEKLAAQAKLPAYEDAALAVTDIEKQAKVLQESMLSLLRKRVRPPPKKSTSSAKKSASSKAQSAKTAASSAAAAATDKVKEAAEAVKEKVEDAAEQAGEQIKSATEGAGKPHDEL